MADYQMHRAGFNRQAACRGHFKRPGIDEMSMYRVEIYRGLTFMYDFECHAEDAEHAIEQAQDACMQDERPAKVWKLDAA